MIRLVAAAIAVVSALCPAALRAHELRPAYLEVRETAAETYDLFWKVPARGEALLPLELVLPTGCTDTTPRGVTRDTAAVATRWSIRCAGGLDGESIRIKGLEQTLSEAIVRYERQDGTAQTERLFRGTTSFTLAGRSTLQGVAATYLPLGFEHILLGFDHLCFVFALLLLTDGLRRLFWAITAFTVAHSITLALATLGHVAAPPGPVEALIAFSIVLVAAEVVRGARGMPSRTAKRPWIAAFVFGLLHGLGFAGALAETGLPQDAIPLALVFFNVGVELGQMAFVLAVVAATHLAQRAFRSGGSAYRLLPAYTIGSIAAFWSLERVAGLLP